MHAHHHTHDEGKKDWKSYLWEFLMLFFAVDVVGAEKQLY